MDSIFADGRKLARLFLLMAVAPLAGALVSQYFFAMKPCHLCIAQRVPYIVIIFFALISYLKPSQKFFLIAAVIIIHAFLVDSGIAFYHIGVENHWWASGDCTANLNMAGSIADLQKSLLEAPTVRCDEVQFEFLGLSMAGWNFIYALLAGLFSIFAFIKYIKFSRNKNVAG